MTDIWSKTDGRSREVYVVEPTMTRFDAFEARRLAQIEFEKYGSYGIIQVARYSAAMEGGPGLWVMTAIEIGA